MTELPEIDVQDVTAGEVMLDVREPHEWDAGHEAHAIHIPLRELPGRVGEIPEGRPVSVVCRVGGRSATAVEWLLEQGVPAQNVRGGMLAWVQAGLPVEGEII
jgi:rhodanese-related sulfurtransferase